MSHLLLLFALEGILLQFTGSINSFGNNLFATNLGATDSQIGLIQTIPNLVAMFLLLPLGILSDRAKNARVVPLCTLLTMGTGYIIMACVPMSEQIRIPLFFFALAFTVGSTVLYNAQWQNFFGDAVTVKQQNEVLTTRNRFMFLIGIAAPVICGVLMNHQSDSSGKLHILQLFFVVCAIVAFLQAWIISRIPVPAHVPDSKQGSLSELKKAIWEIGHTKEFMFFFLVVVFFYMTWQYDWSMWYIGQVEYLKLNETELSIYSGIFNVGQLFAIGLMSRSIIRRGADYTLTYAAVGLITCPLSMMLCTIIPKPFCFPVFTILITVLNATQCASGLCIVQILLRVAPKAHRSIAISLYTLTITFTNCFMPYLGIKLYSALGSNYRAFILYNCSTVILRFIALFLFLYRNRKIRTSQAG